MQAKSNKVKTKFGPGVLYVMFMLLVIFIINSHTHSLEICCFGNKILILLMYIFLLKIKWKTKKFTLSEQLKNTSKKAKKKAKYLDLIVHFLPLVYDVQLKLGPGWLNELGRWI